MLAQLIDFNFLTVEIIAVLSGALVFLIGITIISSVQRKNKEAQYRSVYMNQMESYFEQVSDTMYGRFYKKFISPYSAKDKNFIDKIAESLHINTNIVEEDIKRADLTDQITIHEYTTMKAIGYIGGILFLLAAVLTGITAFYVIGIGFYFLFAYMPDSKIKGKLKEKQAAIEFELPNFFELVRTAAEAGLNINDAINSVASRLNTPIAKEFALVNAETKINGGQWRLAVENMLERNKIDSFTDIMSDILVSIEKGSSVLDVLDKDIVFLREMKVNVVKAKVAKTNTTMMFIMMLFEMLPFFVLLMAPVIFDIMASL